MFLKLTLSTDGTVLIINMDNVVVMAPHEGGTWIETLHSHYNVKETLDEINISKKRGR